MNEYLFYPNLKPVRMVTDSQMVPKGCQGRLGQCHPKLTLLWKYPISTTGILVMSTVFL